jgi:UDP-N-acetylmuramate dehydrogenase
MKEKARLEKTLKCIKGVRVRAFEPMSLHTSFQVGGSVDLFIEVPSEGALVEVLKVLANEDCPWMTLGFGTNILVSDDGLDGAVVRIVGELARHIEIHGNSVEVGAGYSLGNLLQSARESKLSGLECLYGIPGSVGGAVTMNAGTRWGCVKDTLKAVKVASADGSEWMDASELSLNYRRCDLPERAVVATARFELQNGLSEISERTLREVKEHRTKNQPKGKGNAGSFFKNPDMAKGIYAGKLIEDANLKGVSIGKAFVSPVHANFLSCAPGGTAREVLELACAVRDAVLQRTGIALEPEVIIIGRGIEDYLEKLGLSRRGSHVV